MSIAAIESVWEYSEQKGTGLLVLQFIAKHENVDGVAFPGIPRIARYCKITETYVYRILKQLEKSRDLYIRHGGGRRIKNLYLIPHGKSIEQVQSILTLKQYFSLDGVTAHLHATWLKDERGEQPVIEIPSQSKKSLSIRNGEPQYTVSNPEPQYTVSDREKGANPEPQEQNTVQTDTQTVNGSTPESTAKSNLIKNPINTAHANRKKVIDPTLYALQAAEEIDPDKAEPNDIEKYFGCHRNEFLTIWQDEATEPAKGRERTKIIALAQENGACPERWRLALSEAFDNWTGNGRPSWKRITDIYKAGGTYAQMTEAKIKSGEWKKNGGPTNGSANGSSAGHNQTDSDNLDRRIDAKLARLSA